MLPGRTKKILIGAIVFFVALIATINFTDLCRLEAVTLDGSSVSDYAGTLGLSGDRTILGQPLDSLAHAMLAQSDIRKVDIACDLPDGLTITTNSFVPVCFVVSPVTGKVYGIDRHARLVPLQDEDIDWECPVLTNVRDLEMFEQCGDVRVTLLVEQLGHLRDDQEDLFRLITEIDFASPEFLVVSVSGLRYTLWVTADKVHDQITGYVRFVSRYQPDMTDTRLVDLRFNDMIVCSTKDRANG